jgi:hypothetical protein
MCGAAGLERTWQRQCALAVSIREIRIARGKSETVVATDCGKEAQLELEVEVENKTAQNSRLLRILLTEVDRTRANDVEKLQAHGGDSAEVIRARVAFRTGVLDLDPRREACRIDLGHGRNEEKVDTRLFGETRVALLVPRIAREVVVCPELGRVDEERYDYDLAFGASCTEQRQMSVVERSHRRNETDTDAEVERCAELADGAHGLHFAVTSARTS